MALATRDPQRSVTAPSGAYAYALGGLAIAGIWVSVALASIFAPDLVSGSQHEHLPIAALQDWVWGAIATGAVVLAAAEGIRAGATSRTTWTVLGAGVAAVWLAVLIVSVFAPVMVTGSDPTRLPLAAILSPILGTVATGFVCGLVRVGFRTQAPTAAAAAPDASAAAASPAPGEGGGDIASRLGELAQLREAGLIDDQDFEAKKREILSRL